MMIRKLKQDEREVSLRAFTLNYTITQIADECGITRQSMYEALRDIADGNRNVIYLQVDKKDVIQWAFEKGFIAREGGHPFEYRKPVFGFKQLKEGRG